MTQVLDDLVALLARPDRVGAAPAAIVRALEHEIVFHRDGAGLPRREHGGGWSIMRGQSGVGGRPGVARITR